MSEYTSNLQLFKYDTATDGKEVFSINASMNDNWDKIDAFAAGIKSLSNLDEQGEKRFTDINAELNKKLEADVLLAENGYIKFNNGFLIQWGVYQSLQETQNNYVNITPAVLIQKLLCSVAIILFGGYGTNIYFYGIQQGGQIRFRKEARTGAVAPDRFFWLCFNV